MTQAVSSVSAMAIHVSGVVQGIGFRPYIWRQAQNFGLTGEVSNSPAGVTIVLEGEVEALHAFLDALPREAPPLAQITSISHEISPPSGFTGFHIVHSTHGEAADTLIPADIATCHECLREIMDPANRRFGYPFTNCTNCGPRYTLIGGMPYDRPYTSMATFPMCEACRTEYENPADRRFHAQPNACASCGPRLIFVDRDGNTPDASPIAVAAALLREGGVLAVKGLGGFHLAVDASNAHAVRSLRRRKKREQKPFALMCRSIEEARKLVHISMEEEALLTSPKAPIVLLQKRDNEPCLIDSCIAPGVGTLGIMLPSTPLHHMLLEEGPSVQVMTSGNISGDPVIIHNQDAVTSLQRIADGFLLHNREILQRNDDSVSQIALGRELPIRRARGYAPLPIHLSAPMPSVLACGAIMKNTLCLTKGKMAFLSQHLGEMQQEKPIEFFHETALSMQQLLGITPEVVAHDLHPDAESTTFAKSITGVKLVAVQHHHAHIAACMAENQVRGPVIGVALDGTGFGDDGTIWGGEVLLVEGATYQRAAHIAQTPMPGGEAAIRDPWRMAAAHLLTHGIMGWDEAARHVPLPNHLFPDETFEILHQMMEKGINCPLTSSMGRLFDAVAGLTGVCQRVTYEGEAAILLQVAAQKAWPQAPYPFAWHREGDLRTISITPLFKAMMRDIRAGISGEVIAARFHATLIELFPLLCDTLREETGINDVALSGGVFQNKLLLEEMVRGLQTFGFKVHTHHLVPPGDGGLSLGQAIIAGEGALMR